MSDEIVLSEASLSALTVIRTAMEQARQDGYRITRGRFFKQRWNSNEMGYRRYCCPLGAVLIEKAGIAFDPSPNSGGIGESAEAVSMPFDWAYGFIRAIDGKPSYPDEHPDNRQGYAAGLLIRKELSK